MDTSPEANPIGYMDGMLQYTLPGVDSSQMNDSEWCYLVALMSEIGKKGLRRGGGF